MMSKFISLSKKYIKESIKVKEIEFSFKRDN